MCGLLLRFRLHATGCIILTLQSCFTHFALVRTLCAAKLNGLDNVVMLQVDKQYRSIMRTVHGRPGALQVCPRRSCCGLAGSLICS